MKTLYLLRHAKSDWTDFFSSNLIISDHDRPLAERGFLDCQKISRYFTVNKVELDLVLISSALRAQATFDQVKSYIGEVSSKVDKALYTFNMRNLIQIIRKCDNAMEKVLIIGHNPAFQELAIYLCEDNSISSIRDKIEYKFPTASLVRLDLNIASWSEIVPKCGDLIHFVRPKDC